MIHINPFTDSPSRGIYRFVLIDSKQLDNREIMHLAHDLQLLDEEEFWDLVTEEFSGTKEQLKALINQRT